MLPNYLIIGAARCGTSWIARNLMLHPDVYLPFRKEVHFFDRHYEKGIDWYQKNFQNRPEKAIGEATPDYLYFDNVPKLIHNLTPDVKLIVSLRNPVDRAYSHYWNLIAKNQYNARSQNISFEKMLREVHPRIFDEGLYLEKLKRYNALFPSENILILLYDDLKTDPQTFMKSIYAFLGVDTDFISPILTQKINAGSSKLGKSTVFSFIHYSFTKVGFYRWAKGIDKLNAKELPEMNSHTRHKLLEKYLPEIEALEAYLDRDLSAWKQISPPK